MTFDDYKKLARIVFPELPETFEAMPDDLKIYQLVFCYTCPEDARKFDGYDFFQRANLYSITHCTTLQIYHLYKFGKTFWE